MSQKEFVLTAPGLKTKYDPPKWLNEMIGYKDLNAGMGS